MPHKVVQGITSLSLWFGVYLERTNKESAHGLVYLEPTKN